VRYAIWAFALGSLSAVSLPLGSWIGLRFRFRTDQIAVLAAFGAGALLAALSVELVAPTTMALLEAGPAGDATAAFHALVGGCVVGGLLYVALNAAVNSRGGFLRKRSTLLTHYRRLAREEQRTILERLAAIPLFHGLSADQLDVLMAALEPVRFHDADVVFRDGEEAEAVYVVVSGGIDVDLRGDRMEAAVQEQEVLGLLSVMSGARYSATAIARGDVTALRIDRRRLQDLREASPEFDRTCRDAAAGALEKLAAHADQRSGRALQWLREAERALSERGALPAVSASRAPAGEEHHGAPLAVWLGILLDGIPESLVIGAGMLGLLSAGLAAGDAVAFVDVIPFTLIAGLFLSNFPEALSSSANMAAQGWSPRRVFLMWFALMVVTGAGSWVGYLVAGGLDHTRVALFEGVAAGAMLTMIAAAMIPEAALMASGNAVGLATLAGFLGAILFKLLE
jgi:CRP-like cAMP-binding protein